MAAAKTKQIGILEGGMSGLMSSVSCNSFPALNCHQKHWPHIFFQSFFLSSKDPDNTQFLLSSVGFHDWTIIEASGRIGGRVHTAYLNNTRPDQYQYQEMGPMRFPVNITYSTNDTVEINDHKMVFQLADAINNYNGNDSALMVNFIE